MELEPAEAELSFSFSIDADAPLEAPPAALLEEPAEALPDSVLSLAEEPVLAEELVLVSVELDALPLAEGDVVVLAEPLTEGEVLLPAEALSLGSVEDEALVLGAVVEAVEDDCSLVTPWLMVDDVLVSVEDWFAEAPLCTDWLPLEPTLTPGLMFAPALMSVLLMPTLASTPTFGLALMVLPLLVCAKAGPNAPITAAAVILTASFLNFIALAPFVAMNAARTSQAACRENS